MTAKCFDTILALLNIRYKSGLGNGSRQIHCLNSYMINIKTYLFLGCLCLLGFLSENKAQELHNEVFNDEIKSVRIFPVGFPLAPPIIPMGGRLRVVFDDIGEYQRDLEYTIVHCNQNWAPSDLSVYEYIEGFDDATLLDFTTSRGTYVDYTIHELFLPNVDIQWKVSGNYILKIWDRDNDDELLTHLRFVVYESGIEFSEAELFRSTRQGFYNSHHELSFALGLKNIALDDPMRSVSASVFQNFDWHTLRDSIPPRRFMLDQLFFDQHNAVVFPAMREYRLADLRSLSASNFGVHEVQAFQDGINVTMKTDELRGYEEKFGNDWDLNGAFVIDHSDSSNFQEWELEYAHVMFTLHYFNAPPDADVYILGPFNGYTADESSKMEFEGSTSIFYKELLLKQGVYDYVYGVKESDGPIDFSITEGFDNRSQNDYHALIYYRPFLGTYDRVISYGNITR